MPVIEVVDVRSLQKAIELFLNQIDLPPTTSLDSPDWIVFIVNKKKVQK